eukprot:GFYU01012510.1.p1 GENE.GFYU01012510.1~~GFYU01012510.1.p1  ORF type:complete len:654 (+),score=236.46 GFYU01012510.1:64-2025(+)
MLKSVYQPDPAVSQRAHVKSMDEYKKMYDRSINDPEGFWSDIANTFHWEKQWDKVREWNFSKKAGRVSVEWFIGGKTNLCYNCVDRHVEKFGDKKALLWEGNDVGEDSALTFKELKDQVCKFANVLKSMGVKKGDPVCIYLPMVNELPISMLACARIGAVHSVVFGGFSAHALSDRVMDCKSRVIVTADGVLRGKKPIHLKDVVDEAIQMCAEKGHGVEHSIVYRRLADKIDIKWNASTDKWWHEVMDAASTECKVEWMDAEDPLFILYTSGSTGTPKGVQHTTGGYMIYTATTFKYIFDNHDDDVWWCTADCGWITGHSYIVYGPLLNAASCVVFEGVPTHPDSGRFWEVVDKYKVTQFYTAPTAIRALMRFGDDPVKKYNRSSLRILGSVGEPINPEAWRWYHEVVGDKRCPIVDTWWQTETGGIMITPLPGATPLKPGSATLPFFGIKPAVLDQDGKTLDGECEGYLVISEPWPSTLRTVYGNHERYEAGYFGMFDGYYLTGDGCKRDKDGYYWLTGRIDDIINVSGHRIGTAEIESALVLHPAVAEAAVVGYPHDIKGEGIYAYVTLKAGYEYNNELIAPLKGQCRSEIGAIATPDVIHWAPGLPKTRSGKIMRRILRKIAHNEHDTLGDVSTLAEPAVVEQLIKSKPV